MTLLSKASNNRKSGLLLLLNKHNQQKHINIINKMLGKLKANRLWVDQSLKEILLTVGADSTLRHHEHHEASQAAVMPPTTRLFA
mmetsp:Transcript_6104/g.11674  ORF Transcript_6104/g.11674 Transcript_6104/m.11674 type:complete len:85 (+) Transcript_6104:129-383(+)